MRTADFHYDLPEELIAQYPLPGRADSRLLIVSGARRDHRTFRDLPELLQPGDHLVFNDTRVVPARLFGRKPSGGRVEVMLERVMNAGHVLTRLRSSRSPKAGSEVILEGGGQEYMATVAGRVDDLFELAPAPGQAESSLADFIEAHGEIPLPPYIDRAPDDRDSERYQTIYARAQGAVAAPTAGLHFDTQLFDQLESRGVTHSFVTLHVGAGTFQPVRVEELSTHTMHSERVSVGAETVNAIKRTRLGGGRVIAVGTTCVRALESAVEQQGGILAPWQGETRLFLTPGCRFQAVDGLITNFHLPESTLLMLVSAFTGFDHVMAAYREAIEQRYRFFSYGDAMLLWPQCRGIRSAATSATASVLQPGDVSSADLTITSSTE